MPIHPDIYIDGFDMLSAAGGSAKEAFCNLGEGVPRSRIQESREANPYHFHPDAIETISLFRDSAAGRLYRDHDRSALALATSAARLKGNAEWPLDLSRCGVVAASSRGATALLEESFEVFFRMGRVGAKTSPLTSAGVFSSLIAGLWQCGGGQFSLSSTCTSGLNAVGITSQLIRSGLWEMGIAGATEAPLTPFTYAMMSAAQVSPFSSPSSVSFPQQLQSLGAGDGVKGMILGEGAGAVLLSKQRSERSCAKIASFAMATETSGLTGISPSAQCLQEAMKQSLADAGWQPDEVDLVVPHGSGTLRGDLAESRAYGEFFGGNPPPMFPTKWLTGHTLGAAGILALGFALEALVKDHFFPAPYSLLPGLHSHRRTRPLRRIMICALGFGGGASSLLLEGL